MSGKPELDLILDLFSLCKKYGVDQIAAVDGLLYEPRPDEGFYALLKALSNRELLLGTISRASERALSEMRRERRLSALGEESRRLAARFAEDISSEKLFPKGSELASFADRCHADLLAQAQRQTLAALLIDYALSLPEDQMRRLVEEAYRRGGGGNTLSNWADVILRK